MPELPRFGLMVVWSWILVTGVSAAGAGLFADQSVHCWRSRRWGHVDRVLLDRVPHSCRGLVSVTWAFADLSKELSCGWSFLPIFVLFGMLGACWMIAIVLPFLNLLLLDLRGRGAVRID